MRDILARCGAEWPQPEDPGSSVAYTDRVPQEALDALEACIVVSSESIQSQTVAELIRTLAILARHLPAPLVDRVADIASRALSSFGKHVLTRELEVAFANLAEGLRAAGRRDTAQAVETATAALMVSLGRLHSRSDRVPSGNS